MEWFEAANPTKNANRAEILQGTLDLMVLQVLATIGPSHGYAIATRLEHVPNGSLQLNMGTLYPGLMRLEQRGLAQATWGAPTIIGERASTRSRLPGGVN